LGVACPRCSDGQTPEKMAAREISAGDAASMPSVPEFRSQARQKGREGRKKMASQIRAPARSILFAGPFNVRTFCGVASSSLVDCRTVRDCVKDPVPVLTDTIAYVALILLDKDRGIRYVTIAMRVAGHLRFELWGFCASRILQGLQ
jgi:hypothetical protein